MMGLFGLFKKLNTELNAKHEEVNPHAAKAAQATGGAPANAAVGINKPAKPAAPTSASQKLQEKARASN